MAEENEPAGAATPARKAGSDRTTGLPYVESPPLSPAGESCDASTAYEPVLEPTDVVLWQPPARPHFRVRPRHKRAALLAASVTIAAALGVVAGVAASGGFAARKPVLGIAERQALERKLGKLDEELASLKASAAVASEPAQSTFAKISERPRNAPEITGSIPMPPAAAAMPLPTPRPAAADGRASLVPHWSISYVRDGYVFVRGRGAVYRVEIGAPLPGLGPVRAVKRRDGRWLVVTPKGLIVARRDRSYFARF